MKPQQATPSRRVRLLAPCPGVLILAAMLLASPAPARAEAAPPAPPAVGEPVRVFTVPDLDGAAVDVASLIHGKVGVLAMWASWCEPCLAEIPKLRDLSRAYRDRGLAVVGIGLEQGEETPAKQRRMAAKQLVNYMLLFDAKREFQSAYGLRSLPFTILVGPDGKVRWSGSSLPSDFEARIQALLKEASGGGHGG